MPAPVISNPLAPLAVFALDLTGRPVTLAGIPTNVTTPIPNIKAPIGIVALDPLTGDIVPPNSNPPEPSLPFWGDLTTVENAIDNTNAGDVVSQNVRAVLMGPNASSAVISIVDQSGDDPIAAGWSISGGDNLAISSSLPASGSLAGVFELNAHVPAVGDVLSTPMSWQRTAVAPPPVVYKYFPGFYPMHESLDNYSASFATQLQALTAVEGITIWVSWFSLEPSKGTYSFTALDAAIADAKSKGLKYIIQVQDRTFSGSVRQVPSYIQSEGYLYQKNNGANHGTIPKLWNATCMGYWLNLQTALSGRYDSDASCAGMRGEETDIGFGNSEFAAAGFNEASYLTQMLRQNTTYSTVIWPTTIKWIGLNFMPNQTDFETLAYDVFAKTQYGLGGMGSDLIPSSLTDWLNEVLDGKTWNGSAWVPGGTVYRGDVMGEAQVQDPEMGDGNGNFKPSVFVGVLATRQIRFLVVFDKNFAWDPATYGIPNNQQTYWDSGLAGDDTYRWRQSFAANPTWTTYQTRPPALP